MAVERKKMRVSNDFPIELLELLEQLRTQQKRIIVMLTLFNVFPI